MIKTFTHMADGKPVQLCATLGEGQSAHTAIISWAESAETLVIIEVTSLLETIKAGIEAPASFLDDAVRKAEHDGLIDRAIQSGEIQKGTL